MFGELYSLERGGDLFMSDGRTLAAGELLASPGSSQALEALSEEGAASVYRGSLAEALLAVDGLVFSRGDLAGYRADLARPGVVELYGRRVATRGGLSGIPELLPRLPRLAGSHATERVLALVDAFEPVPAGGEHTTNMVAVDATAGHAR